MFTGKSFKANLYFCVWMRPTIGKDGRKRAEILREESLVCRAQPPFLPAVAEAFFTNFAYPSRSSDGARSPPAAWLHFERKAQSLREIKFPTARPTATRRTAALQSAVWQSSCGRIDVASYIRYMKLRLSRPPRSSLWPLASSAAHK